MLAPANIDGLWEESIIDAESDGSQEGLPDHLRGLELHTPYQDVLSNIVYACASAVI
jgi:hypothetical protein